MRAKSFASVPPAPALISIKALFSSSAAKTICSFWLLNQELTLSEIERISFSIVSSAISTNSLQDKTSSLREFNSVTVEYISEYSFNSFGSALF